MSGTSAEAKLLGRYDAHEVRERLTAAGVPAALEKKGFDALEVTIDATAHALPCALVSACRRGERSLLLEACLGELTVSGDFFARRGYPLDRPLDFVLVHWMREQDPTRRFSAERPPLPLQWHPGLGVLRRVFHAVVSMAADLGKDGVACVPKFFHDAVLFFRSRLFLFLDGTEQGRFEALLRDLSALPLSDASLALVAGCVSERSAGIVSWSPGYQAFPVSARTTAYFHSSAYATAVARALEDVRFSSDAGCLARTREALGLSTPA
jgi:hypothetical protein